ncbi:MAG TPA: carboxyltransferase domain-containing protein [Thermoanaerobaculia bacterium]|nr:carboxyltransferase domain-containing protein [Thermoanaerobaculia bacterium]
MDRATVSRAGDAAILVDLPEASFDELYAAAAAARQHLAPAACIVGHSSLYLLFDTSPPPEQTVLVAIRSLTNPGTQTGVRTVHRIRVSVTPESAPDLPRLLQQASLSPEAFLRQLAALSLRARHLGFRAGFAYLDGIPPSWKLPRLATPRLRVPAGSFAIAGPMAAFYPIESPGGWNLLGRTDAILWDPQRDPPNLIQPGDEISIEPHADPISFASGSIRERDEPDGEPLAEVISAGQGTIIVGQPDHGRLHYGLAPAGAFDANAARAANSAVGNDATAPLLECVLVGPELRFRRNTIVAWRGATIEPLVDGRLVPDSSRFELPAGARLRIGRIRNGMRGWLAIDGGIADPAVRFASTPALLAGSLHMPDSRSLGAVRARTIATESSPSLAGLVRSADPACGNEDAATMSDEGDAMIITAMAGPHTIDGELLRLLQSATWQVTPELNRVAIRLRSPEKVPSLPAMLPSCGMQFGTVQWHPGGELVVMGPDHPVTGGYLQAMTVIRSERWKLAQLAPGDRVRWRIVPVE